MENITIGCSSCVFAYNPSNTGSTCCALETDDDDRLCSAEELRVGCNLMEVQCSCGNIFTPRLPYFGEDCPYCQEKGDSAHGICLKDGVCSGRLAGACPTCEDLNNHVK